MASLLIICLALAGALVVTIILGIIADNEDLTLFGILGLFIVGLFGFGLLANVVNVDEQTILHSRSEYLYYKFPERVVLELRQPAFTMTFEDIISYRLIDDSTAVLVEVDKINSYGSITARHWSIRSKGEEGSPQWNSLPGN